MTGIPCCKQRFNVIYNKKYISTNEKPNKKYK